MAAKESVGLEGNVLSSVLPTVVQAHWKSKSGGAAEGRARRSGGGAA